MNDEDRIIALLFAVAKARDVFNLLTDINPSEIAEIKAIARRTSAEMQRTLDAIYPAK